MADQDTWSADHQKWLERFLADADHLKDEDVNEEPEDW